MTFEDWWVKNDKGHYGIAIAKEAFLAGQAIARSVYDMSEIALLRDKCAELKRERDNIKVLYESHGKSMKQALDENVRLYGQIATLKAQAGEHIRRWNIEPDGDDLLICDGNHDKHEKCEYIRYTPASTVKAQAGELCGNCFEGKSDMDHVCPKCNGTGFAHPTTEPVKAQAGEPVSKYHALAMQVDPVLNPTTERPYNPLNDYAVIPMPTTERRVIPEDVRKVMEMALEVLEYHIIQSPTGKGSKEATALRNALNAAPAKGEV